MKKCIDEGTLQAWFDGELAAGEAAKVATHISACAECAAAVRAVESENLMLSEALAPEFAFASEVIRVRMRAGLTQEQLAQRMETSQSVIARLEGGRSKPSTQTLERLAAATGTRLMRKGRDRRP